MKPPATVRIGHSTWTVRGIDRASAKMLADDGQLVLSERWLNYTVGYHPEREREIITHECVHGIIDAIGGAKAAGFENDEDEERLVSLFTGPLLSTLRDNPALVKYLTAP